MGITEHLEDPGIFPQAEVPPLMGHENLQCDIQNFRNYKGEEEAEMLRCADGAPADAWTQLRGRRLQSARAPERSLPNMS